MQLLLLFEIFEKVNNLILLNMPSLHISIFVKDFINKEKGEGGRDVWMKQKRKNSISEKLILQKYKLMLIPANRTV